MNSYIEEFNKSVEKLPVIPGYKVIVKNIECHTSFEDFINDAVTVTFEFEYVKIEEYGK